MLGDKKLCVKIVLTGSVDSGKTTIFEKFSTIKDKTIVKCQENVISRNIKFNYENKMASVGINLWDTAGLERYVNMCNFYYHGAKAAILCYDLTNVMSWHNSIHHFYSLKDVEEDCKVYLVGTKLDLIEYERAKRQVKLETVTDFVNLNCANCFEISTFNDSDVFDIFQVIAEDFYRDWKFREDLKVYAESIIVKNGDFVVKKEGCNFAECFNKS